MPRLALIAFGDFSLVLTLRSLGCLKEQEYEKGDVWSITWRDLLGRTAWCRDGSIHSDPSPAGLLSWLPRNYEQIPGEHWENRTTKQRYFPRPLSASEKDFLSPNSIFCPRYPSMDFSSMKLQSSSLNSRKGACVLRCGASLGFGSDLGKVASFLLCCISEFTTTTAKNAVPRRCCVRPASCDCYGQSRLWVQRSVG